MSINPSIGQIGAAYFDPKNQRIKLFAPEIYRSEREVANSAMSCADLMKINEATRFTGRYLLQNGVDVEGVANYLDEELSHLNYRAFVEAQIPLNNGFSGVNIAYIGINHISRLEPPRVLEQEDEIIRKVLTAQPHVRQRGEHQILKNCELMPYVASIVNLYSEAFPYYTVDLNPQTVERMIENSQVYAIVDKGEVVSIAAAEIDSIPTGMSDLRLCELSEMATRRTHRKRGLMEELTAHLVEDTQDGLELFYAEARAPHSSSNYVFRKSGFSHAGRLNKHCVIQGDREVEESGTTENLNVWYSLPKERR